MASEWFARWASLYAEVFGMTDEADIRALLSWEDALAASEQEMFGASDWLAANPGAFGASESRFAGRLAMHLGALQVALREQRAIAYRREIADVEKHGTCTRCGNTGRVVVPHVSGISNGEWVPMKIARAGSSYYTMAVWCSCRLGRWMEGNHKVDLWGKLLSLEQYALRNPGWESQMERRQRKQTALAALSPESPAWAALVRRLLEQARSAYQALRDVEEEGA